MALHYNTKNGHFKDKGSNELIWAIDAKQLSPAIDSIKLFLKLRINLRS